MSQPKTSHPWRKSARKPAPLAGKPTYAEARLVYHHVFLGWSLKRIQFAVVPRLTLRQVRVLAERAQALRERRR